MELPVDFVSRTRAILGDEFEALAEALETDSPVSIRINRKKHTPLPAPEKGFEAVPWCESGYYLPERLSFTFDPLLHAGAYYVQEASSMFLNAVIRQYVESPVCCLDLCAAPGGKSTLLADSLPAGSLLVSNEVIRSRSHILAENLCKWGNPNHAVINNDPKEIGQLRHLFDVIVTDVPCSGEGMFRKDKASRDEWSTANVELCASRQRRILHDCMDALKPGGLLIYSTCTYNAEENEENIHYLTEACGAVALPVDTDPAWHITPALKYDHPVYHFFPHKTKGEGFFLAVLRKPEGITETIRTKAKGKKEKNVMQQPIPEQAARLIQPGLPGTFVWRNNKLLFLPESLQAVYPLLQEKMNLLTAGIEIGELKGKDLIPSQALALSTALNRDAFPSVELSWEEAIRYLRKEAVQLPPDTARGFVLLTYQEFPLGFVKHLGNRSNNLYPQEWRIRSGYLPEKVITY